MLYATMIDHIFTIWSKDNFNERKACETVYTKKKHALVVQELLYLSIQTHLHKDIELGAKLICYEDVE